MALTKRQVNKPADETVQVWRDIRSGAGVPRLSSLHFEFYSPVKFRRELRDPPRLDGDIVEQAGELVGVWDQIREGGLG